MKTGKSKHIGQKTVEVIKKTVEETANSLTFHLQLKLTDLKTVKS